MFKQMDVESSTSKRKRCCKQASIKLLKAVKKKQEAVESRDHPRPGTESDRENMDI